MNGSVSPPLAATRTTNQRSGAIATAAFESGPRVRLDSAKATFPCTRFILQPFPGKRIMRELRSSRKREPGDCRSLRFPQAAFQPGGVSRMQQNASP